MHKLGLFSIVLLLVGCKGNVTSSFDNSYSSSSDLYVSSEEISSTSLLSLEDSIVPSTSTYSSSLDSSSEVNTYMVTFLNYDDSFLYFCIVNEGEDAEYLGEEPTKEENDEFTYKFIGWDKDITNVKENITTKAQFESEGKNNWSDITWRD